MLTRRGHSCRFVDFNEIWSFDSKANIIGPCPSISVNTHYLQRCLMFQFSTDILQRYTSLYLNLQPALA